MIQKTIRNGTREIITFEMGDLKKWNPNETWWNRTRQLVIEDINPHHEQTITERGWERTDDFIPVQFQVFQVCQISHGSRDGAIDSTA